MKKRYFEVLFALSLALGVIVFSCKKKEDTPKKEVTANVKSVQKDEPPRSKKKLGEFDAEGESVATPSTFNNSSSPETEAKLSILGSSSSSNTRQVAVNTLKGWTLTSKNNSTVSEVALYFFKENGVYYYYDYASKNWDWGFYYINNGLTQLVFDPSSTNQDSWKISELTTTKLSITTSNNSLTFTPFALDNFTEEGYTQAETFSLLKDRDWYYSSYVNGDLQTCQINNNITRVFYENGTYIDFKSANPIDTANWLIRDSKLVLKANTANEVSYNIDYFYDNDFGLSVRNNTLNTYNELYCLNQNSYNTYYQKEIADINSKTICCDPCSQYSGCYDADKCDWNTYGCEVCNTSSTTTYRRTACIKYGQNCP